MGGEAVRANGPAARGVHGNPRVLRHEHPPANERGTSAKVGGADLARSTMMCLAFAMPLDFSLNPGTRHAPAERESIDAIKAEQTAILGSGAAAAILDTLRDPVAVVNGMRQIVHANKAFLVFAGAERLDDILGMRLGEFLGCAHAAGDMGGCGTHQSCQTCGAVNAVLAANAGSELTSETDLAVTSGGRERRLRFEVTAAPFDAAGWRFVLMTIRGARWASPK